MSGIEFLISIAISAVSLAIGLAMFWAIDVAVACRRSQAMPTQRNPMLVFGWLLLVLGGLGMIDIVAVLVVALFQGELNAQNSVQATALLAAGLALSLVPIGGAVLLTVGGLLGRERSSQEMAILFHRLDALSIIAWCCIVVGVVITSVATLGGFPMIILVLAAVVVGMRRSSQQDGLIWVLAIAAQKKLSLAAAVEECASQCRGRYRRRVLGLADRLHAGESLPEAIDADPRLLPPQARVAARVGWESGVVGAAMRDVAVSRSLHRPAWQAALGRLLLLVLPLLVLQSVAGFIMVFIMPKFKKIFMDFGIELPEITRIVCDLGDDIVEGASLPIILLLELLIGFYLLMSFRAGGFFWGQFPVDRLFRAVDRGVILRALAVCVEGGHTLTAGLRSLANCYPKLWIRARLERVIERINAGSSWVECIQSQGLIRQTDAAVLESAQRAGNLSWAMREMADRGERQLGYLLEVFSQVLFPIVVLGVAGVIFLFAVAYFGPLVKLISELAA